MRCPHCGHQAHLEEHTHQLYDPKKTYLNGARTRTYHPNLSVVQKNCPGCHRISLFLKTRKVQPGFDGMTSGVDFKEYLLYPRTGGRPPCPPEVPAELAEDYKEACLVLQDSPKASAALSRRCLQNFLHNHRNIRKQNLSQEIQEFVQQGGMPFHVAEIVDAVRNIGNFAAHPQKSQSTGEILPVEPGEAEWCLDVLEAIFETFFVQPAIIAKKKAAFNAKLQDAGKPTMN